MSGEAAGSGHSRQRDELGKGMVAGGIMAQQGDSSEPGISGTQITKWMCG